MATKKKGTGLLMVWCDVPADKEDEFNRWYNEEHLAERLALPGFLNGARLTFKPKDPSKLAEFRTQVRARVEHMKKDNCSMMEEMMHGMGGMMKTTEK